MTPLCAPSLGQWPLLCRCCWYLGGIRVLLVASCTYVAIHSWLHCSKSHCSPPLLVAGQSKRPTSSFWNFPWALRMGPLWHTQQLMYVCTDPPPPHPALSPLVPQTCHARSPCSIHVADKSDCFPPCMHGLFLYINANLPARLPSVRWMHAGQRRGNIQQPAGNYWQQG